jgi:hypothetical protein
LGLVKFRLIEVTVNQTRVPITKWVHAFITFLFQDEHSVVFSVGYDEQTLIKTALLLNA